MNFKNPVHIYIKDMKVRPPTVEEFLSRNDGPLPESTIGQLGTFRYALKSDPDKCRKAQQLAMSEMKAWQDHHNMSDTDRHHCHLDQTEACTTCDPEGLYMIYFWFYTSGPCVGTMFFRGGNVLVEQ